MDEVRIIGARTVENIKSTEPTEGGNELKKDVNQKIREEEKEKIKEEEERRKKVESEIKKYVINEDDMKVLLLMFGSRGNTTLLEQIIEKRKKEKHG
jgi:hypothetical protein